MNYLFFTKSTELRVRLCILILLMIAPGQAALAAPTDADDVNPTIIRMNQLINDIPFFNENEVNKYVRDTQRDIELLKNSPDKQRFIEKCGLNDRLIEAELQNQEQSASLNETGLKLVHDLNCEKSEKTKMTTLIAETLQSRLNARVAVTKELAQAIKQANNPESADNGDNDAILGLDKNAFYNYLIIGGIVLILLIWLVIKVVRRGKNNKRRAYTPRTAEHEVSQTEAQESIVVRRRTTSILKKQSLDDVIGNPAYLEIDTADFTADSAVRRIYVLNTCIKEIYNLYSEDLRMSDNPKEDGCMVLGRWVYDPESQTYDVSLEEVVFPGDDAVFQEYELNFGGIIKLRVAERLRRLRRESNLQYDLTCWVHSHPGLTVFFSNSDCTVQDQLKHHQHPNFLTAFVIDILTDKQDLGIFTYRPDGSILSRNDITKLYSLEDMYKWALESDRNTFNPEKYYNILQNAPSRNRKLWGIELDNNAIIDLAQICEQATDGIAGWAIGKTLDEPNGKECIINSILPADQKPHSGVQGCLIAMAHTSLPTIQRLIASENSALNLVLVYSTKQQSLTAIPIIDGQLVADENSYSEINIDDLKIWTRRKR